MQQKFKPSRLAWLVALALSGVQAQESTIVLGEVTVNSGNTGSLPTRSILTSVDVMGAERVQDKNVMNSWELIGQMPGVQLTEFRLGAESGKPSFRAFNGEGYINGIKLLIDGVPSNINSGNMRYLDMIFPLDIDYVEVVRGTNDPRYGLHNIGGNINIATRQGGNYTDGRLTVGSFNTQELQAALGRESGGFAQSYFVAKQDSDGYRDHSKSEKYSLGGKWFYTSDAGDLKAGLIARIYNHEAEEAGYLTAAELGANRFQSPARNANDHDSRDMQQFSGHLDYQIAQNLAYSGKLYYNSIEDDRHVTYNEETSPAKNNQSRQRRIWDEEHVGWINTLTWQASKQVAIEGGFNYEHQDNRYRRYRYAYAVPTDFSTPASTSNDESYTFDNFGAYVQAIIRPSESWKIVPAIRTDTFKGHTTLNTTGQTGPLQDYGWINQPKLSVVYSPSQAFSIYGNWGRSFQIPTGSKNPAYLLPATNAINPSINTGLELGTKLRLGQRTEARIAIWQQDATDEIANLPSADTTKNLGETRRKGIDLQLTTNIVENVKFWFSHSIQEAKVVGGYSSLSGKEVFSTPRYISNVGIEYRASESLRFDLQGRAQGNYYIDDLNTKGKYGGYVLFDGGAHYTLSKTVGIDLQVKNIFDRKYEYVWYDTIWASPQPMFSPGAGRAFYASLNVKM